MRLEAALATMTRMFGDPPDILWTLAQGDAYKAVNMIPYA